jgi:hypothetical protein
MTYNPELAVLIKRLRLSKLEWSFIMSHVLTTDEIEHMLEFYVAQHNIKTSYRLAKIPQYAMNGIEGKIHCIKKIREITGLGLKEAKDLSEGCSVSMEISHARELSKYYVDVFGIPVINSLTGENV